MCSAEGGERAKACDQVLFLNLNVERKGKELGVDVLEKGQEMEYIVRRKLVQNLQGNFKCVARASM